MLKIKELMAAFQQLSPDAQELPVCAVLKAREVMAGQLEGAVLLFNKPVIGAAMTPEGLFLFTEEDSELRENHMIGMMPPGFKTGNTDIDARNAEEPEDRADDWKKDDSSAGS